MQSLHDDDNRRITRVNTVPDRGIKTLIYFFPDQCRISVFRFNRIINNRVHLKKSSGLFSLVKKSSSVSSSSTFPAPNPVTCPPAAVAYTPPSSVVYHFFFESVRCLICTLGNSSRYASDLIRSFTPSELSRASSLA